MSQSRELQVQHDAELRKVLESETFRHADSLRRLLQYLGEKCLSGADGLKEYTIGVEAFHKPEDYDPQQDPTVRVLASKLRHKLDEYYGKEGAGSAVRLEIPRGHYELRFNSQTDGTLTVAGRESLNARMRRWRLAAIVLGTGFVLLMLLAFHWRSQTPTARQIEAALGIDWTPELEMIWQPFLNSEHQLTISLGTPLFTKMSRSFFRNPRINDWPEAQASDQIKGLQKELQSDYAVPAYPYTGVGEASGAFLLCRLLQSRKHDLMLKRSNTLSWDDLKSSDVIFLGSPKFNPHLKEIPADEGFAIERGAIRNPSPRPGEPDAYRSTWSEDQTQLLEDYALIYRLPGPHEHGDLMILASASTEATWAAVEYVTQPVHARELVSKVKLPSGQLPVSFQVVIRVEFKQQTPWRISFVSHRIIAQPWKTSRAAP